MSPISHPLMLPTAPSGYTVVPALPSRLMVNSTGHLVSTGQLQASDAGTYNITSNSNQLTGSTNSCTEDYWSVRLSSIVTNPFIVAVY